MSSIINDHLSAHTHGRGYAPRLVGEERKARALRLGVDYDAGATIRALAAQQGMTYGTVRKLLLEAKVKLRKRGGRAARSE